jgi:ribosome recycling factor
MQYNFTNLKTKIKDAEEWLKRENSQIRTGRASINLVDTIQVESYGSMLPINQIASLTTEDARTIRISPWDASQIKEVEKVLIKSNLGVSVAVDDKGLRVSFPELTTERRTQVLKVAKEKLEQGKISLRKLRDEAWDEIQKKEEEGGMSEDEKFRFKAEMEKLIQEAGKSMEGLYKKKEEEIMN